MLFLVDCFFSYKTIRLIDAQKTKEDFVFAVSKILCVCFILYFVNKNTINLSSLDILKKVSF